MPPVSAYPVAPQHTCTPSPHLPRPPTCPRPRPRPPPLQVSIAAKEHNVPVYVAAESYKFARLFPLNQRDMPLERKQLDFGPLLPASVTIDNPSRDYTPPQVRGSGCGSESQEGQAGPGGTPAGSWQFAHQRTPLRAVPAPIRPAVVPPHLPTSPPPLCPPAVHHAAVHRSGCADSRRGQ